ncbi:MAG TPA: hypothetical protein VKC65_01510 [Gaiellaceae bacterium]|nr:hypothetical protein [Gaiellaceae bacterium]
MGRAASVLALAIYLGAYYTWAESLPSVSLWWEIAIISLLVIPPVFALVYFALPLRTARWLLPAGIGVALLAAALELVGLEVLANFAKLAAVTMLAWWFLGFFETAAWVTVVALIVPWVDAVSVWRGPTKHVITQQPQLFTTFSFAFPVPGEHNTAQLGLPDLLFFALFLGAADRWGLRVRLTWLAMALSFGATLALTAALDINGLPALPLLALGFLAPNADLLWRKLRSEDAWGSLRSERSETG